MINPNELRIGNQVLHKGAIIVIDGIDKSNECVMVEDKHITIPLTDIEPIPLTPEWLERLGFEFEDCGEYTESSWHGFNGRFSLDANKEGYKLIYNDDWDTCFVIVKHVHQLQNLYFSLTGEELTIKETV